jgi:hypothetical protein
VNGALIKGTLDFEPTTGVDPEAILPEVLHVQGIADLPSVRVSLCDAKAVFFVKQKEGRREHEEVKFFSDVEASELWLRVCFADGEILEGRAVNSLRLFVDEGIWLKPLDSTANNTLIYVPKSSLTDLQVMGVPAAAKRKPETNLKSTTN